MALEAVNIAFRYPDSTRYVLEGLSIHVAPGESVGLIAPSGQGKTTLCRILAGYEAAERGTVRVDGQPLPRHGYCPVQMIWQHPEQALNPRMRMRDVLAEGDGVLPHVIDGLGIREAWLSRFPAELSGGELQRFCIARALGERTRYILADEISTMLDLVTQQQIWTFLLQEAQRRGIGLLAVSHVEPLLERICTRQLSLATQ